MKDVKVEVMRSRGAGGQHVNKTESAVRLTHQPTGITVSMQDSRSQHQNRSKAFLVLRSRLLDHKLQADRDARRSSRRSQVKTSDRGEKIRTYNYPQDRVTDHRGPAEVKGLEDVMEGGHKLDALSAAVQAADEQDRLAALQEEVDAEAAA
jgi:peptide chain release factor 1